MQKQRESLTLSEPTARSVESYRDRLRAWMNGMIGGDRPFPSKNRWTKAARVANTTLSRFLNPGLGDDAPTPTAATIQKLWLAACAEGDRLGLPVAPPPRIDAAPLGRGDRRTAADDLLAAVNDYWGRGNRGAAADTAEDFARAARKPQGQGVDAKEDRDVE